MPRLSSRVSAHYTAISFGELAATIGVAAPDPAPGTSFEEGNGGDDEDGGLKDESEDESERQDDGDDS